MLTSAVEIVWVVIMEYCEGDGHAFACDGSGDYINLKIKQMFSITALQSTQPGRYIFEGVLSKNDSP